MTDSKEVQSEWNLRLLFHSIGSNLSWTLPCPQHEQKAPFALAAILDHEKSQPQGEGDTHIDEENLEETEPVCTNQLSRADC